MYPVSPYVSPYTTICKRIETIVSFSLFSFTRRTGRDRLNSTRRIKNSYIRLLVWPECFRCNKYAPLIESVAYTCIRERDRDNDPSLIIGLAHRTMIRMQ